MLHELLDMTVNIIPSQVFFFTDLVWTTTITEVRVESTSVIIKEDKSETKGLLE
jgi:hypothetical protein